MRQRSGWNLLIEKRLRVFGNSMDALLNSAAIKLALRMVARQEANPNPSLK